MGRTVELGNDPIEIGRSDECAITVNSAVVSRKHARVQLVYGLYFVTDLESANGTFVGEQRVSMSQLKDGDQIRVGECVLKFVENHIEVEYAQRAKNLATLDALTGTHNKRHFDEVFPREIGRASQARVPLSLAIFDLDNFKRINDTFGHQVGDQALKSVAMTAQKVLARDVPLCRVGGEEFAILMPNIPGSVARAVAERLRAAIADTPFEHDGQPIPLTISVGIAELAAADSAELLYQRADQQLYAAKQAGRNQVKIG
jgi:diguanylate cyclase (GGDEF)-like protein